MRKAGKACPVLCGQKLPRLLERRLGAGEPIGEEVGKVLRQQGRLQGIEPRLLEERQLLPAGPIRFLDPVRAAILAPATGSSCSTVARKASGSIGFDT